MTTHKIKEGDTLSSIAKRYGTTVDAIAANNGIKDKNLIYAGDTLNIPQGQISKSNALPVTGNKSQGKTGAEEDIALWQTKRPAAPEKSYDDEIRSLVYDLTGADFSYDPEKDIAYRLIRDENRKNARLAMEDTLGRATALTGGYANSYASSAAQQAYAGELSKTAELIPELFEAAYGRFSDDRDALSDSIKLLSDLDNAEFDKYTTLLKQYLSEGETLFDNYRWESEEEFDRFLDYAELLQKAAE